MPKYLIRNIIVAFTVVLSVFQSIAQVEISGVVKTTQGRVVDFANVIITPANSPKQILASAFTDENGRFSISAHCECDSLLLKASSIEISPATIKIPNRSGTHDIIVEDKTIELKEVVVKSKKIYSQGDTIN